MALELVPGVTSVRWELLWGDCAHFLIMELVQGSWNARLV